MGVREIKCVRVFEREGERESERERECEREREREGGREGERERERERGERERVDLGYHFTKNLSLNLLQYICR